MSVRLREPRHRQIRQQTLALSSILPFSKLNRYYLLCCTNNNSTVYLQLVLGSLLNVHGTATAIEIYLESPRGCAIGPPVAPPDPVGSSRRYSVATLWYR